MVKDKQLYKTLFKLALPAAFQGVISLLLNYMDVIMVSPLGDQVLAGVSQANQISGLFGTIVMGVASGSTVMVSQYWGRRDETRIKQIFAMVFQICIAIAVLVLLAILIFPRSVLGIVIGEANVVDAAVPYITTVCFSYILFALSSPMVSLLRCVEMVTITFYISISSLLINVVFNYAFIFGAFGIIPAMGARGAALATVIARTVEFLIVFRYLFKKQKAITIKPKDLLHSDKLMWKDYARHGLPVAIGDMQWGLVGICKAAIIGQLGQTMMAAFGMAESVMSLGTIFTGSLAGAACVIIGKTVGAKEYKKTRDYSNTIQVIYACVGVIMALVIFFTRGITPGLYAASEEARTLATQFIGVAAFTLIGTCYHAACFVGINRGAGDGRFVFIVDMICGWGIVIPLTLLVAFVFKSPLPLIYFTIRCDQSFKWIIAFFRLRGNKWIRNVTRD